jgi:Pyruvate/2-oxoacid:ferredoxin oxidoreductase delta subunit
VTGRRRGFFRDALDGLKQLAHELDGGPTEGAAPVVPTFIPPPHGPEAPAERDTPATAPKARVHEKLCLNTWRNQRAIAFTEGGALDDVDDGPCERCVDWCPEPGAIALGADTIPRVDETKCTGCGACAEHCAAYPAAISLGSGRA